MHRQQLMQKNLLTQENKVYKMAINMTESQIDDLAEEALNIACLTIQNTLKVNDGGYAGMFF